MGDAPTFAQQQADALALLAETALHHGLDPGAPGERYQVVVHVDGPVLADPGQPWTVRPGGRARTFPRKLRAAWRAMPAGWSCATTTRDASWRSGPGPGRFPRALRRALHHRDQGCRFPGCGFPFGQGHHVRHWAQGGPTTLSNLALLCRRHHRAVHEDGYQVEPEPDGALRFRRPDGRPLPEVPPPPRVPDDPMDDLRRNTSRAAFASTHGRHAPAGWGSPWMSAGPSTSCILWPPARGRSHTERHGPQGESSS